MFHGTKAQCVDQWCARSLKVLDHVKKGTNGRLGSSEVRVAQVKKVREQVKEAHMGDN